MNGREMKILFLANLADHFSGLHDIKSIDSQMSCSALGLSYPLNLLKELAQYAEVQIYSPPILYTYEYEMPPSNYRFIASRRQKCIVPMTTDVEILAKNICPDIVIQFAESIFPYLVNFEKLSCRRMMWFPANPTQAVDDRAICDFISTQNVDLIIKSVDKFNKLQFSQKLADLGVKVDWLPFSIDGERFRYKALERVYDGAVIGNINPHTYFLRVRIYDFLYNRLPLSFFSSEAFGDEYVKAINQTKIFFTCTGKHRYPIVKFFEALM